MGSFENFNSAPDSLNEQINDLSNVLDGEELLSLIDSGNFKDLINDGSQKNETISVDNGLIELNFDEKGQLILSEKTAIKLGLGSSWGERNLNSLWDSDNAMHTSQNFDLIINNISEVLSNNSYQQLVINNTDIGNEQNIIVSKTIKIEKGSNDYINEVSISENNEYLSESDSLLTMENQFVKTGLGDKSMLKRYYEKNNSFTIEEKTTTLLYIASKGNSSQIESFQNNLSKMNFSKDFLMKVKEHFNNNFQANISKREIKQFGGVFGKIIMNGAHNLGEVLTKPLSSKKKRHYKKVF